MFKESKLHGAQASEALSSVSSIETDSSAQTEGASQRIQHGERRRQRGIPFRTVRIPDINNSGDKSLWVGGSFCRCNVRLLFLWPWSLFCFCSSGPPPTLTQRSCPLQAPLCHSWGRAGLHSTCLSGVGGVRPEASPTRNPIDSETDGQKDAQKYR